MTPSVQHKIDEVDAVQPKIYRRVNVTANSRDVAFEVLCGYQEYLPAGSVIPTTDIHGFNEPSNMRPG